MINTDNELTTCYDNEIKKKKKSDQQVVLLKILVSYVPFHFDHLSTNYFIFARLLA
jgi:hypothetical protein